MRPKKTREQTRAENDTKLLAAGRRVFLAKGFHGATLEQVSSAAGLTKGAVYARFDSKADLFFALLEEHIAQRLSELRAATERASSPRQAARDAALQWMTRSRSDKAWALLLIEFRVHVAREPALLERYRALHARLRDGVAAMAEEVYARAEQVPPMASGDWARLTLALGNGAVLERWADGADDWDELYADLCESLAVRGLPEVT